MSEKKRNGWFDGFAIAGIIEVIFAAFGAALN